MFVLSVFAAASTLSRQTSVEASQDDGRTVLENSEVVDVPVHAAPLRVDILVAGVLVLDVNLGVEESYCHQSCNYYIDDRAEVVDAAAFEQLCFLI